MKFHSREISRPDNSSVFLVFLVLGLSLFLSDTGLAEFAYNLNNPGEAQPDSLNVPAVPDKPPRPWQLVLGIGRRNDNGRWDDLLKGLEAGGFDDSYCEGWFGPCKYPEGGPQYQVFHIAVARDLKRNLGFRVFWSNGDFVEGTGFLDDTSVQVNYLNVECKMWSLGLLTEYVPTRAVRLGLGPSWNTLKTKASTQDHAGNEVENFSLSSGFAGLVLSAAANYPPDNPLFIHFALQYHLLANQEIGPFGTMPATSISMSHTALVLALGLGI
jgi:hypothetical protein